jgi:rhodanese-related sulfurtransferase
MDRNHPTLSARVIKPWLGALLLLAWGGNAAQAQASAAPAASSASAISPANPASTANPASSVGSANPGSAASAANPSGLHPALKRPPGSCVNENLPTVNSPAAPNWPADLSCAISVPELQKLLSAPDTTLVDLRHKDDYQTWHINGALNLATADLHSKPYWRNKLVVLLGNGKAEREAYAECGHLKQIAYSRVRVLRGGMPAWLAQQGPVLGRPLQTAAQMQRLSVAEFWLESQNPDHLLLLSPTQKALRQELPLATLLAQDTPAVVLAQLARHKKETRAAPLSGVLLAAPANISDEQITRLQQAVLPLPLLVYADSRAAVQQHVAQQKQIWLAQARGPKQLGCGL